MPRIIVPLDESELAEQALPWAAILARALSATVHLAAVYTYDEEIWIRAGVSGDASPAAIANAVSAYLDATAAGAALTGLAVTTEVRLGNVAEQVSAMAAEEDTRMIVLASHGEGGIKRWARGSVADELVREVHLPLLVIRPGHVPAFRRVVVTLDGSETSEAALPAVRAIADAAGAEVHLLRVVNPVTEVAWTGLGPAPDLGDVTEQFSEAARAYLQRTARPGEVCEVYYGRPLDAILEYARTSDCDVIAMGSHGRGGIVRLALGSTADAVVRAADRPVLIVPHHEHRART